MIISCLSRRLQARNKKENWKRLNKLLIVSRVVLVFVLSLPSLLTLEMEVQLKINEEIMMKRDFTN